jgi:hypothetical protein
MASWPLQELTRLQAAREPRDLSMPHTFTGLSSDENGRGVDAPVSGARQWAPAVRGACGSKGLAPPLL